MDFFKDQTSKKWDLPRPQYQKMDYLTCYKIVKEIAAALYSSTYAKT